MSAQRDPVPPSGQAVATDASPQHLRSLAHAARHDILRRLTPPLRHDLVVHLQSLGMTAEALGARMERGTVAADDLQAAVSKLNRLSRQAVARCLEVCSWMEPPEDDTTALAEGVDEVTRLLATSLNFQGLDLRVEAGEARLAVSRSALRFLLAAAILALADAAPAPGGIVLRTGASNTHGVVTVAYQAHADAAFTQAHEAGAAPLDWDEVQALATLEHVELLRGEHEVVLHLPRARVTTALKMVPV